jgi:hypothetical protein
MGALRNTIFWMENLKVRNHLEDLVVDGKIILECVLGKEDGKVWASVWGPVAGFFEHGNEPSGSVGGGEFLD